MRSLPGRRTGPRYAVWLLLATACAPTPEPAIEPAAEAAAETLRVAVFNIKELRTAELTDVDGNGVGRDDRARAAARIIQRIRPDVLVLNEIDHDYSAVDEGLDLNARRFAEAYLAQGAEALRLPFAYATPNNTGLLSGLDLDGDGHAAGAGDRGDRRHGADSFGWGSYPGEYSMAVLSRHPLLGDEARSFQTFRWQDLPDNHLPLGFYAAEAQAVLRLSSKSHWDLPVAIGDRRLHLFVSHPTPPVFDGAEDRNGRRNFDEIKFWIDYLDGAESLVDDAGTRGGYAVEAPFVIIGDLNARPDPTEPGYDGRSAISQLLEDPRIQDTGPVAVSLGALDGRPAGPPAYLERATATFGGGVRVDYALPSADLEVLGGGVFWPAAQEDPDGHRLAAEASDHRLVWIDLRLD